MGKVKQFAEMLEDIENIESERDMYKATCDEFARLIKKLQEEVEELRKKNRELKTEVTYKTTKLHEWVAQNKELKEERDALQEENEKSKKMLLESFRSKSDA